MSRVPTPIPRCSKRSWREPAAPERSCRTTQPTITTMKEKPMKSKTPITQPIITRAEAIAQGLDRYYTGKPCKYGHVDQRYLSNGECVECQQERNNKKTERRRTDAQYREQLNKHRREWAADRKASDPAYLGAHREDVAADQWRKATGGTMHAGYDNERETLQEFYAKCPEGWQVDHSIPKKSAACVGLHTLANLSYVDKRTNIKKGKQFDPDRVRSQRPLNGHKGGAYDPALSDHDYWQAVMLAGMLWAADSQDDLGCLESDPCPVNRLLHKLLTGDASVMHKPFDVTPFREELAEVEIEIAELQALLVKMDSANDRHSRSAA